jgi:hypothetical protein
MKCYMHALITIFHSAPICNIQGNTPVLALRSMGLNTLTVQKKQDWISYQSTVISEKQEKDQN